MHRYRCLGHLSFVPGAFRVAVTLTWRGVSCASDRPARRRRSVVSLGSVARARGVVVGGDSRYLHAPARAGGGGAA